MENSLSTLIDSASGILILLPSKPYFDQVAAALSLYLSLRENKPSTISSSSPMVVGFNRLIGVNRITSEIGNKNLAITFPDYDATNIEKVSYDIENGQFKLTVVPKAGLVAPQENQIQIGHSGVSADLVILVGGANESHFPSLLSKDLKDSKIAHIGTRVLSSESGKVMSFARPASSVSELVASIIKELGLPLDVDTATNLIMGIEEGSNHFESSEVTPDTFEIFAYLLRNGGQRLPKNKLDPKDFPPGSIPSQPFQKQVKQEQAEQTVKIQDSVGTEEQEQNINPPEDWLQPKIYKGTSVS